MLCRALAFEHGEPILFSKRELPTHSLALKRPDGARSVSTIGRNWLSTVSIDDKCTHVDEHHADIFFDPSNDTYSLVPRHETRVNGCRVSATTRLQDGDVIAFGSVPEECTFQFHTKTRRAEQPLFRKRPVRAIEPTLFVNVDESMSRSMVDELTCYTCLDIVENPCVLSCGHMGCEECLVNMVQHSGNGVATCGLCRAPFELSQINPCIGLRYIVTELQRKNELKSINV